MIDADAVRFVYFDLDDTLLDHRAAERAALADCCADDEHFADHALEHVQETYHRHNVPLWKQYAAGEIGRADVQRLRFERLCETLDVDLDADALGEAYMQHYARRWQWMDGAEAAFRTVAERFPVGILTNGFADAQHAKLDRFPILRERSAAIVVSEEVGAMKPQPAIFAHATEQAGVAPSEILYVGDSLHSDVEGGRAAGWQVAWFRGDESVRDDVLAFDDWDLLLDRLKS